MTITAHKLGGPPGVGALLLAATLEPVPLLHGGGQERDVRSGTLDVPAIVGLRRGARGGRRRDRRRARTRASARSATPGRRRLGRRCPTRCSTATTGSTRTTGCPATRTSPSPAARATRCCCCSTPQGIECSHRLGLLGRGRRSPATCCWPWAPTRPPPAARCASRSAAPRPTADVDAVVGAIGPAVERARRRAAQRPG